MGRTKHGDFPLAAAAGLQNLVQLLPKAPASLFEQFVRFINHQPLNAIKKVNYSKRKSTLQKNTRSNN